MKKLRVLLSCLISVVVTSSASGAWVPLTNPEPISSLPGGVLVVGDKEFSEFEVAGISEGGALVPSADTVLVQGGENDETGDYGLRFRPTYDAWDATSNQLINAGINYKVSILPGYNEWFIEDATFWLATAGATGTGLVQASENIYDAEFMGNLLALLSCSKQAGDGDINLDDYADFDLIREIWVRTPFIVVGGNDGTARLSEVIQFYSQIPEPATVLLLGLGGLALLRKRRN